MEKVRPWCGQLSDRGRLKNETEHIRRHIFTSGSRSVDAKRARLVYTCYLWPWLWPPLAVLQYVVYFGFCRRRRRQRKADEAVAHVLHTARSWAQLRASPADMPQSEQIWCSKVMVVRPHSLCQFGKAGTPSDVAYHAPNCFGRYIIWHTCNVAEQKDGAGVRSTGYSIDPIWCKPQHS